MYSFFSNSSYFANLSHYGTGSSKIQSEIVLRIQQYGTNDTSPTEKHIFHVTTIPFHCLTGFLAVFCAIRTDNSRSSAAWVPLKKGPPYFWELGKLKGPLLPQRSKGPPYFQFYDLSTAYRGLPFLFTC